MANRWLSQPRGKPIFALKTVRFLNRRGDRRCRRRRGAKALLRRKPSRENRNTLPTWWRSQRSLSRPQTQGGTRQRRWWLLRGEWQCNSPRLTIESWRESKSRYHAMSSCGGSSESVRRGELVLAAKSFHDATATTILGRQFPFRSEPHAKQFCITPCHRCQQGKETPENKRLSPSQEIKRASRPVIVTRSL